MNRLKKKTQYELAGVVGLCILITPVWIFLSKIDAQGFDTLLIGLAAGLVATFFAGLTEFRFYLKLDERERDIYIKGFIFSVFIFVGFWMVFTLSTFLIVGGQGVVPVRILPLALLGSFLVSQASETIFLTIYLLKEDEEGGLV